MSQVEGASYSSLWLLGVILGNSKAICLVVFWPAHDELALATIRVMNPSLEVFCEVFNRILDSESYEKHDPNRPVKIGIKRLDKFICCLVFLIVVTN